jgi:DNA-binding FrmR family transcriptional regulator
MSDIVNESPNTEEISCTTSAETTSTIALRLRRIEGQIRGITRMIEDDRSCEDVITQLLAVRSAMDRVASEVVRIHVDKCLTSLEPDDAKTTISRIVELFNKMI